MDQTQTFDRKSQRPQETLHLSRCKNKHRRATAANSGPVASPVYVCIQPLPIPLATKRNITHYPKEKRFKWCGKQTNMEAPPIFHFWFAHAERWRLPEHSSCEQPRLQALRRYGAAAVHGVLITCPDQTVTRLDGAQFECKLHTNKHLSV